jgi:hypothetical protein
MFCLVVLAAKGLQVLQAIVAALTEWPYVVTFQRLCCVTFCASVPISNEGQISSFAVLGPSDSLTASVAAESMYHAPCFKRCTAFWVLTLSRHFTIPFASDCEYEGRLHYTFGSNIWVPRSLYHSLLALSLWVSLWRRPSYSLVCTSIIA